LEDQKSWEPKTLTEVGEMIDAFMQTEPRSTYAVTGQDLEDEFRRLTGQLEDE
jgi:hypothetical protein